MRPIGRELENNMKPKIELFGAVLPEGWTAEQLDDNNLRIERMQDSMGFRGDVQISYRKRIYCDGTHLSEKSSTYSGRGWKKRLIEDACAWLKKTMES